MCGETTKNKVGTKKSNGALELIDRARLATAKLAQVAQSNKRQNAGVGFALAARAARLRCALAARVHSQLLFCSAKKNEFIHDNCKKYLNSYMIRIHICSNSYI